MDAEEKSVEADKMKDQHLSAKNRRPVIHNSSQDAAVGHPRDAAGQSDSFSEVGDRSVNKPEVYAPQPHATYYKGYNKANGEYDEYPPCFGAEGLDIGSSGIYNDNASLLFHTGYGYNLQMPFGPHSPVTTPFPSVAGDAQLYSPQQFSFSGPPYFQQLVPPRMPYISSPTPVSPPGPNSFMSIDQQVDGMLYGPRAAYLSPRGSYGRCNVSGNTGSLGFQDSQQGFDEFRSNGRWSDWLKPYQQHKSLAPLSSSLPPQSIGTVGSFGQNVGMASRQLNSFYGSGSASNSYSRGYSGFNQGGGTSFSSLGTKGRGWLALDNVKQQSGGSSSLYSCSGTLDILTEQNRGPRASKPRSPIDNPADGGKRSYSAAKICIESFNHHDFETEYNDAKFFIIKSYSEDNVHKSIKYGVWASTPNGNRKLDAAYHDANDKQSTSHVFLLFSVNASAQFCGVAEMSGPVDFEKSVDYWQQDKWSGQFPVRWHIIKDVPNSQFRHILLENNDNKPVTNSRDTQEVKLQQGIEMLNIFKNYETEISILDDFSFYEDRQQAMQERKARQQANLVADGIIGGNENKDVVSLSNDFIKQMSKSFAQVVRLEENVKGHVADKAIAALDDSMSPRVELQDVSTITSSAQTS